METKKGKSKKVLYIILGITLTITSLITIGGFIWYSSLERVNIFDFVEITEKGYINKGTVFAELSFEGKDLTDGEKKLQAMIEEKDVMPITLSRDTPLTNGDEVTLTHQISKKEALKNGIVLSETTLLHTTSRFLSVPKTWGDVVNKEKIIDHVMDISEKYRVDFEARREADSNAAHGTNPQVYVTFEPLEILYKDSPYSCYLPENPQDPSESGEGESIFDWCGEAVFVFKATSTIDAPYYYPPEDVYAIFTINSILEMDEDIIFKEIAHDPEWLFHYINSDVDEFNRFHEHYEKTPFTV